MHTNDQQNQSRMRELTKAKLSTKWMFFICGLGLSSWAPMVPFAKERLQLDDAQLGLLLLVLGAGALIMMPVSGVLVHRIGSKIVTTMAAIAISLLLPLLLVMSSVAGLAVVLFLFGVSIGTIDVAMNTQAVQVQNMWGKPIMSSFHGLFSVGGLAGSVGLGLLIKAGLNPVAAAVTIAVVILVICIWQYRYLLDAAVEKQVAVQFGTDKNYTNKTAVYWFKGAVIFLGLMSFMVFLAEGALLDWSAVFLAENRSVEEAFTGLGYAAFSVAMAVMRLVGDGLVSRWSERTVVVWGSLIAAAGLMIAISLPWLLTTLLGFMLVGIGAANIVPVFFSQGGRMKDVPAAVAIPVITTLGYGGQLAGPALIGFIAFKYSLTIALAFNALLLLIVAISFLFKK